MAAPAMQRHQQRHAELALLRRPRRHVQQVATIAAVVAQRDRLFGPGHARRTTDRAHGILQTAQVGEHAADAIAHREHATDADVEVDPRREAECPRIADARPTGRQRLDPRAEPVAHLLGLEADRVHFDHLRHLVAEHRGDGRLGQHALAVVAALADQHAQEARVVVERRHRTTGHPRQRRGARFTTDRQQRAEPGPGHAERRRDAFAEQFVPVLAADAHRRHRGDLEADAAVTERRARLLTDAGLRRSRRELVHVHAAHRALQPRRHATGASEALPQRQAALVVAIELGQVARDRQVEVELALVDQRQDRRHRQPLARRRDRHLGIRGDVAVQVAMQQRIRIGDRQASTLQLQAADRALERVVERRQARRLCRQHGTEQDDGDQGGSHDAVLSANACPGTKSAAPTTSPGLIQAVWWPGNRGKPATAGDFMSLFALHAPPGCRRIRPGQDGRR